ncbi:hypothetical protein GCM10010384_28810 [Streptomyces djakartensis]|uniref:Uncharacterized protein n=1 Tax=Streptomyces djakartensis TaxID=68193 RepID=A0ABQ2ZN37_9ACTN|nr:hypothetical protein GCM10010384_28810 [Streptomyces djakartensis]
MGAAEAADRLRRPAVPDGEAASIERGVRTWGGPRVSRARRSAPFLLPGQGIHRTPVGRLHVHSGTFSNRWDDVDRTTRGAGVTPATAPVKRPLREPAGITDTHVPRLRA